MLKDSMTPEQIDDAICNIMMVYGPDEHVDGHEELTAFVVALLEGRGLPEVASASSANAEMASEPVGDGSPLAGIQSALKAWHKSNYPDATDSDVGLKLAEETGEVCRALDRLMYAQSEHDHNLWTWNLAEEIGDAMICLIVLAARHELDAGGVVAMRAAEVMGRPSRVEAGPGA